MISFLASMILVLTLAVVVPVLTVLLPSTAFHYMEKWFGNIVLSSMAAILTFLIFTYFMITSGWDNILVWDNILTFVYAVFLMCAAWIAFVLMLALPVLVHEFMQKIFGNDRVSWVSAILTILTIFYVLINFMKS